MEEKTTPMTPALVERGRKLEEGMEGWGGQNVFPVIGAGDRCQREPRDIRAIERTGAR
jgi:hypothetical protein